VWTGCEACPTSFELLPGGFLRVLVGVELACFRGMMRGMSVVAVRYVSVVAGLLVVTCLVMIGGGMVMGGCVLVVFGGLAVMTDSLLRRGEPLSEIQRTSLEE
jgi:hypothetical protein